MFELQAFYFNIILINGQSKRQEYKFLMDVSINTLLKYSKWSLKI